MKKLFCLLAISCLLITSCTSDNDTPPPNENNTLLKRMVVTSDGNQTINFTYNGNKILTESDEFTVKTFTYSGNQIIKTRTSDNDGPQSEETFTYDSNGRLIVYLMQYTPNNDDFGERTTFTYDANNTVTSTTYSGTRLVQDFIQKTRVIHLLASGVIGSAEITEYYDTGAYEPYTLTYEYDAKNNPFKNVIGFSKLNLIETFGKEEFAAGNHNVLIKSWTNSNINFINSSTYTYNDLNFPDWSEHTYTGDINMYTTTHYYYE